MLPTEAQYVSAFRAFRKRFPWVQEFATWDETNYYGEATYDKEGLVASYYRGLRAACSSCTILAAEFLDVPAPHQAVLDDDLGCTRSSRTSATSRVTGGSTTTRTPTT